MNRWVGVPLIAVLLLASGCAQAGTGGAAPAPAPAAQADRPAAEPQPMGPRTALTVSYSALVASQSPPWIAKEAGIFDKYNLDVNFTLIAGGYESTAALLAGETDAAVLGGVSVVLARLQGNDLIFLGGTKNVMVGELVGKAEITSPQALVGKKVGVTSKGANSYYYALGALKKLGMDPERDVIFLPTGGTPQALAALETGNVDAISAQAPFNQVAKNMGFVTILDITAMKVPFLATQLASTERTIKAKREPLTRFVRAMAEGVHRYLTDKDYALKVISEYTKQGDLEALALGYEEEKAIMARDLQIGPAAIQAALDSVASENPAAASARPSDFADESFTRDLKDSGLLDRLWK